MSVSKTTTTTTTTTAADGTTTIVTTTVLSPGAPKSAHPRADVWAQVVSKAWDDPNFAQQLKNDPAKVLGHFGITLEPGEVLHVHFNSATERHLVVPAKPDDLSVVEDGNLLIGDANPGF